jgi:hypothetical protein
MDKQQLVVVGVDGSDGADHVVDLALKFAPPGSKGLFVFIEPGEEEGFLADPFHDVRMIKTSKTAKSHSFSLLESRCSGSVHGEQERSGAEGKV